MRAKTISHEEHEGHEGAAHATRLGRSTGRLRRPRVEPDGKEQTGPRIHAGLFLRSCSTRGRPDTGRPVDRPFVAFVPFVASVLAGTEGQDNSDQAPKGTKREHEGARSPSVQSRFAGWSNHERGQCDPETESAQTTIPRVNSLQPRTRVGGYANLNGTHGVGEICL